MPRLWPVFFSITALLLTASTLCAADEAAPGANQFLAPDDTIPIESPLTVLQDSVSLPTHGRRDSGPRGVVQWREFSSEAFAEAGRVNKPVFLFITSNWMRSARTMEQTTFADLQVATRLNEEFIPVRLDRDLRPDIDYRVQQALQLLGGARGWPASVCATSEGRIWYGATFLPVDDDAAAGRPGMRSVIQYTVQAWNKEAQQVFKQAQALQTSVEKNGETPFAGEYPADLLDKSARATEAAFDEKSGGIVLSGVSAARVSGPRFPVPRAIDLLLRNYQKGARKQCLEIVEKSLNAMLDGGIYDQLTGGFHRYSSDRWWRVPSFEKLPAVNAEMLTVLLHAWQVTKEERYKNAVKETLELWSRPPLSNYGGDAFVGSEAGESVGPDNSLNEYYTWTVKEFEDALRDERDLKIALLHYGIEERNDVPQTDRNVLYVALPADTIAERLHMQENEVKTRLEHVRQCLAEVRKRRSPPAIDKSIYLGANALMAGAFIECGKALEEKKYLEQGLKVLRRMIQSGIIHGDKSLPDMAVHVLNGKDPSQIVPLAQDEAALGYACSLAFEATGDQLFADEAEGSLRRLYANFWDKDNGGYFDRMIPGAKANVLGIESSTWKVKIWRDTWEPSANGLAAQTCVRLGKLTHRQEFYTRAKSILSAFGAALEKAGPAGATISINADDLPR